MKILHAPALLILFAAVSSGTAQAQSSAPRAAESHEEFVTDKGFSSRVFELKHRDPVEIASVIRPLGSGFKGAIVSVNREMRTLTVRDFPENIATIEAALKRLDVPEAARKDVELHIWVLVASNGEAAGRFPDELKEAVSA